MSVQGGLDGVVAAETALSLVDGDRGELIIAGFRVGDLTTKTFEEVVQLLCGPLSLAGRRDVPAPILDLLRWAAKSDVLPMDALRMAVAALPSAGDDREDAANLIARFPTIVAAYARLRWGSD